MNIELHCGSCGKLLRAPRESGGKRSKCPACGHEVYIPTASEDLQELPMAPEDTADMARERALLAERRRLDSILAQEAQDSGDRSSASAERAGGHEVSIDNLVHSYLLAMRDFQQARMDQLLEALRRRRQDAHHVVERLIADQLPPPGLTDIPPGVYQGYLRKLMSEL